MTRKRLCGDRPTSDGNPILGEKGSVVPGTRLVEIQSDGTVLGDSPLVDALPGMIDPVTIQRAYAANVDALKVMDGVLATVASAVGPARLVSARDCVLGSAGTCRRE